VGGSGGPAGRLLTRAFLLLGARGILASCSACSRSKRCSARASIFTFASAMAAKRSSRRSSSSGTDIPSGISPSIRRFGELQQLLHFALQLLLGSSSHARRRAHWSARVGGAPSCRPGDRTHLEHSIALASLSTSTNSALICGQKSLAKRRNGVVIGECSLPAMKRNATESCVARSIARLENTLVA